MNKAKEKLRAGGTVVVFNSNFPSPALVEHAGALGFDVAFIDCEHGTADFERVEDLARAARAGGMTSILRPWSTDPALVTRYLDCGVGGIQFPDIDDANTARQAVDTVRTARGSRFDETIVSAMIESAKGVENINDVAAVPGLDVIVVGLADLARSLGHAKNAQHPAVQHAVDVIISACSNAGVAAGFNLHVWEDAPQLKKKGVRWFTVHARTMLARASQQVRASIGDTQEDART